MMALRKNRLAVLSAVVISVIFLLALFAPWLSHFRFDEQNMDRILLSPNGVNWLGTDNLGRDLWSRLLYGARVSMGVGVVTSLFALVVGVFYGALAGFKGGRVDSSMMRFVDLVYSIPPVPLMILVKVILDAWPLFRDPELESIFSLVIGIGLLSWVHLARVVRNQVLKTKKLPFVESARAMGVSGWNIVSRHILPNIWGPIIIVMTLQIPGNILWESFLSFIGLGLQPPYSSWGVLAAEGWRSLRTYPHLILAPGIALFVTTLSFNILGDTLRDLLDVHS